MIVKHTAIMEPGALEVPLPCLNSAIRFETALVNYTRRRGFNPSSKIFSVNFVSAGLNEIATNEGYFFDRGFVLAWKAATVRANRTQTHIRQVQKLPYLEVSFAFFRGTRRAAFFIVTFKFREGGTIWTHESISGPKTK
ncbi:MAG: hypothetical protein RIT04_503 [Candidatus Parcubacteria bacterium]|jgi:hypothetical protein